eukprot:GHVR01142553.1.p1 GENE.GHVR01142553.1~~GHVR01142553.1.p1  ORF type:complete len:168 (-),score=50.47 GHVR01142553.1:167-670(-)
MDKTLDELIAASGAVRRGQKLSNINNDNGKDNSRDKNWSRPKTLKSFPVGKKTRFDSRRVHRNVNSSHMLLSNNLSVEPRDTPTRPNRRRVVMQTAAGTRKSNNRNDDIMMDGLTHTHTHTQGVYLRISNLDYSILEDDLKEAFSSCGPLSDLWVDYGPDDRSLVRD